MLFLIRVMFGKELFIQFTMRASNGRFFKICVCPSFPFGTEGGLWDVSVLIPDHCLSIYFVFDV